MDEFENIMNEVNAFDRVEDSAEIEQENNTPVIKTMNKETRNHLLKGVLFMGFIGVCAYYKLIDPVLSIPAEILALCSLCYKFGEWRGTLKNGE